MKKIFKYIIGLLLAILPALANAQSTSENYILTKTYKVESQTSLNVNDPYQVTKTVQYFDGIGRIKQSIVFNASTVFGALESIAKDVITHYDYDGFGRQAKEYLPYASENIDGRYERFAKDQTHSYYLAEYADDFSGITDPADINAFSEKIFESVGLNRPVEQTAPGLDWKETNTKVSGKEYSTGHTLKMEYVLNDTLEVKYYPVTTSISGRTYTPSLGSPSYYLPNELSKSIVKDENWSESQTYLLDHTTEEFKNKDGKLVLKRTYNNDQPHDTYYAYDDYGNLAFVIPPKASDVTITSTVLNELCYQYVYDYRNRLVEKKIPGKGWEYIVYDKLDRKVLSQDNNQRNILPKPEWLFTKYDAMGRVIYTGMIVNASSRESYQNSAITGSYTQFEKRGSTNVNGTQVYYTNTSFPGPINEVYTINYYDTYIDLPSGLIVPTEVYGQTVTTNTKGLNTVTKTKVLTTNGWITTAVFYDEKERPIYTYSENTYLGTVDIIENKLDFTGKILETRTTHKKTGKDDIVTVTYFEFDHMDRLINQSQKVNDHISERVVRNNYDDLGKLKTKVIGNGTAKGYTEITAGISVTDDLITKEGSNGWNAGLVTNGRFRDDGYVEYTILQKNKYVIAGLSDTNGGSSFGSVDFGIYVWSENRIRVYENGVDQGVVRNIELGDRVKVERIKNKIYYKHNGETFFVSNKTSTGSLIGDSSFYSTGLRIENFHIVDNTEGLQNADYDYNVRGWLTNVNDVDNMGFDLFGYKLNYNEAIQGSGGGVSLFNGNISQIIWRSASTNTEKRAYSFDYDGLNRLKTAYSRKGSTLSTADRFSMWTNYDKNGNLTRLYRNGHLTANPDADFHSHYGAMDDLVYTYTSNSNRLRRVVDNGNDTFGFKESPSSSSADHYTYDVNGNMTSDSHKGISSITYNHLNLPTSLAINENDFITYVYDANGVKQAKYVVEDGLNVTTTEYAGNYVYQTIGAGNTYLQFFNHAEGYVKSILDESDGSYDYEYIYQYKDHLGSVRLSYSDTNGDGYISGPDDRFNPNEIIEESNYYPFGLKQRGYNTYTSSNGNSVAQRWGYTGKEHQTEVGLAWIDITARNYDAALGRWMNIDILSEKYMDLSPYNYSLNDPILYVDPDGETPLLGAILGAFTEYAGIVGSKMLFDNMSFVEANKDLGWRDVLDIGIAAGFGAVSGALDGGITKFAAWISKGKNQKIVKLLLETAVSAIESSLKAIYKDEDFDLKSILSGALAEVGLGNLLKNDVIKKSAKKNKKKADLAKDRAADLEKRRSPNKKLIDKAKKEASSHSRTAKSLDNLNNTGEAIRDTTKKVVANEVQERTKEEDED